MLSGCRADDGDENPEPISAYETEPEPAIEEVEEVGPVALELGEGYIDTSDWCPNFVQTLRDYEGGALFYGEYLIREQAAGVTELTGHMMHNRGITSLEGIQYFTGLTNLELFRNQLTTLDVSGPPALEELVAWNNQLTALDVSNNPALRILDVVNLPMISFDDDYEPEQGNNRLTALDISNNPVLEVLNIMNNYLTTLDVSNNTSLRSVDVSGNNMSDPDDVIGWQEIELTLADGGWLGLPGGMGDFLYFWP